MKLTRHLPALALAALLFGRDRVVAILRKAVTSL